MNIDVGEKRCGEIDILRAVAIVLMVVFHLVYDLKEFAGVDIDYQAPLWFFIGKASVLLFMFISGISSGFSSSPAKRGVKVLLCGMGVTVATYLVMKDEYVRFGILHFLGVTMILSPIFLRLPKWVLGSLAGFSLLLGLWFKEQVLTTGLFLPFGLMYAGFRTIDYYPLFPYLAVTLTGIITYKTFYAQSSIRNIPFSFEFKLKSKLIQWVSRKSLGIYLVHQPILLLIIFIVNRL
jgi:Predicted membrane protein